jgi:hypothetical protein
MVDLVSERFFIISLHGKIKLPENQRMSSRLKSKNLSKKIYRRLYLWGAAFHSDSNTKNSKIGEIKMHTLKIYVLRLVVAFEKLRYLGEME